MTPLIELIKKRKLPNGIIIALIAGTCTIIGSSITSIITYYSAVEPVLIPIYSTQTKEAENSPTISTQITKISNSQTNSIILTPTVSISFLPTTTEFLTNTKTIESTPTIKTELIIENIPLKVYSDVLNDNSINRSRYTELEIIYDENSIVTYRHIFNFGKNYINSSVLIFKFSHQIDVSDYNSIDYKFYFETTIDMHHDNCNIYLVDTNGYSRSTPCISPFNPDSGITDTVEGNIHNVSIPIKKNFSKLDLQYLSQIYIYSYIFQNTSGLLIYRISDIHFTR
jgi:hypothetical protein